MANKQDILTAIKNLEIFLKVPELKGAKARINKNGSPFVYVGGFNMVFQLTHKYKKWAFRVWHAPIGENKERYLKISKYLTSKKLPYFAEFIYDEKGILINGELVDTIRMEWLDGLLFKDYIEKNISNSTLLMSLADNFLKMCQDLRYHQISHGDLQEGNILVTEKGEVKLVDYDSVCIPEIEGQQEIVTGLKGYQHPSRFKAKTTSLKADYFSELIIYISILAFVEKPELWDKYQVKKTQYLLFSENDFEDLENSKIFGELNGLSDNINKHLAVLKKYLEIDIYTNLKPFSSYSLPPLKKRITHKKSQKTIIKEAPKKTVIAKKTIKTTTAPSKKPNYSFIWAIPILILIIVSIKYSIDSNDDKNKALKIEKALIKKTDEQERIALNKQREKNSFELSVNEAKQLFENEKYSESILILNDAFNSEYVNSSYYWLLGTCYYQNKNYESAIIRFTSSINKNSSDLLSLQWRAYAYFNLNKYELSILDCSNIIETLSDGEVKAKYYNLRGDCYKYLKNSNKAVENYKKAIYNDSSSITYKENLAKIKEQIQNNIIHPLPTNYLYKTKTLYTGHIAPLTKEPYTISKETRNNNNNEDVYVLEKTNPFYFKVYIGGKIGYISKSSLVQKQTQSTSKTYKRNTNIPISNYKIIVTSRMASIYFLPKNKNMYRNENKRSRNTTLTTIDKKNYNGFYKINYYHKGIKAITIGYIRIKDVKII
ncbi:hypothetical protein [Polaribacter sp. NJDZ03]|uniref:protein kinase domain-containing protein n=1 Tax=Polaribacter sp. NJDZ03 TaxID=2855841 RepID=UPI001C4A3855|nr:hypothetical protein [Polaribacter sp. NJDZ03]